MLFLVGFLQVGVSSVGCCSVHANLHQAPFCQGAEVQRHVTKVLVLLPLGTEAGVEPCAGACNTAPQCFLKPAGNLYPWGGPEAYGKEVLHWSLQDPVPIDASHELHFL